MLSDFVFVQIQWPLAGNSYISMYIGEMVFHVTWPLLQHKTRTTRTPAFWGYPPPPNDYPYHWVILEHKSKEDKVKVTNLKNSPKFQKRALHATHLLKLLDKMCKYEMDPMSIVEDTERTRFCPQTDRRTRWYQYTPLSTSLKRGYKNWFLIIHLRAFLFVGSLKA